MCLILHRPAHVVFPEAKLRTAMENNEDGWGLMWHDPAKGGVQIYKTPTSKFSELKDKLEELIEFDVGLHLRWRTHGNIDLENTHPYPILRREADGTDMWMMHNGVLSIDDKDDTTKSDTWHYIRKRLRPMIYETPEVIHIPEVIEAIGDDIGGSNKFLILTDDGKFLRVNDKKWLPMHGCWASNDYSFQPPRTHYAYGWNSASRMYEPDWMDELDDAAWRDEMYADGAEGKDTKKVKQNVCLGVPKFSRYMFDQMSYDEIREMVYNYPDEIADFLTYELD